MDVNCVPLLIENWKGFTGIVKFISQDENSFLKTIHPAVCFENQSGG